MKLYVAIPVHRTIEAAFDACLSRMKRELGIPVKVEYIVGQSLVPLARNMLVARFLKTDCTHLMFIDSDIIFTTEDVQRLIGAQTEIIGGIYPLKKEGVAPECLEREDAADNYGTLVPVKWTGTGFLLIKRSVFARIPAIACKSGIDQIKDWFPTGPANCGGEMVYLSEDQYFCLLAQKAGIPVYVHADVRLGHLGTHIFRTDKPTTA